MGVNLLHELQLLPKTTNRNHSELSMKVDSITTELKSVQLSLSNLIGLQARVNKLEDTIANLLSKNTQLGNMKPTKQNVFTKIKKSLPKGICVDEEYLPKVRIARAKLQPIFKYAAQSDIFKGKCKMLYDSILIHGKKYGVTDLLKLPDDINPLKRSQ